MIIPYEDLEPQTLAALIESFILRDGTDYGNDEVSLKAKTEQILQQLQTGKVVIVYSQLHQSCDFVPRSQLFSD